MVDLLIYGKERWFDSDWHGKLCRQWLALMLSITGYFCCCVENGLFGKQTGKSENKVRNFCNWQTIGEVLGGWDWQSWSRSEKVILGIYFEGTANRNGCKVWKRRLKDDYKFIDQNNYKNGVAIYWKHDCGQGTSLGTGESRIKFETCLLHWIILLDIQMECPAVT